MFLAIVVVLLCSIDGNKFKGFLSSIITLTLMIVALISAYNLDMALINLINRL